jgi:hypothetical protein
METDTTRRPLIVFDLNGCLCRTDYDGGEYGKQGADFTVMRKNVWVRPFLHTMLAHVTANYDIAVWTCNSHAYVVLARPPPSETARARDQPTQRPQVRHSDCARHLWATVFSATLLCLVCERVQWARA